MIIRWLAVFSEKILKNILWVRKNVVTLQPQKRNNGSIAQLNRASHYGCEGYRFESCWSHKSRDAIFCVSFFCLFFVGIMVSSIRLTCPTCLISPTVDFRLLTFFEKIVINVWLFGNNVVSLQSEILSMPYRRKISGS